jgi:hypothetical protein
MTEKELNLRRYELDMRIQESRVRDAKTELDRGYEKLHAEFEKEYAKLKSAYERECLNLERERAYVAKAKEDLAAGFET